MLLKIESESNVKDDEDDEAHVVSPKVSENDIRHQYLTPKVKEVDSDHSWAHLADPAKEEMEAKSEKDADGREEHVETTMTMRIDQILHSPHHWREVNGTEPDVALQMYLHNELMNEIKEKEEIEESYAKCQ